jgi:hypothetical protein
MGGKNGKIVETIQEVQELSAQGLDKAQTAIKDADVAEKVDRLLNFVEENAAVIAAVGRKLAGEAAKEATTAAEAVGEAAESTLEAASEAIEAIGEEVIKPTVRYGRGVRHGILLGAIVAILYTPWPGAQVREKIKGFLREAMDIVDAMRTGAADTRTV